MGSGATVATTVTTMGTSQPDPKQVPSFAAPCPLFVTPKPPPSLVCHLLSRPRWWPMREVSLTPCRLQGHHPRHHHGDTPRSPCCPLCPPGLSYPLFPATSLGRALATKTPPPLFLGTEGRRGDPQGGVASGRSGGSAAVSPVSPKATWVSPNPRPKSCSSHLPPSFLLRGCAGRVLQGFGVKNYWSHPFSGGFGVQSYLGHPISGVFGAQSYGDDPIFRGYKTDWGHPISGVFGAQNYLGHLIFGVFRAHSYWGHPVLGTQLFGSQFLGVLGHKIMGVTPFPRVLGHKIIWVTPFSGVFEAHNYWGRPISEGFGAHNCWGHFILGHAIIGATPSPHFWVVWGTQLLG